MDGAPVTVRGDSDDAEGRLHSESSSYSSPASPSKTRGGTTEGLPGSPSLSKLGGRDGKAYGDKTGEVWVAARLFEL